MEKVKDQLLILITIFLITFLIFKKFNIKLKTLNISKKFYFYSIIIAIFFIWFTNHPQLRYGGYSISFLIISIPLSLLFDRFENKKFSKKFKFIAITIIIIFNLKNIDRINNEIQRTDHYKYDNFPFFYSWKRVCFWNDIIWVSNL